MLVRNRRIGFVQARCLSLLGAIALAVATVSAGGAEPLSLEAVKARLSGRNEKIDSLHLRIRRETTLSVDPEVLLSCPSGPALPEHLGTDEILFAFKADKRYRRVLELDYTPAAGQPTSEAGGLTRRYLDEAWAWNGTNLLQRNRDLRTGKYEYGLIPPEKARDCLPPPEYLMNVGLAFADPTASDEAHRNLQQMGLLPELLERWPYQVSEQTETVDGAECLVLEGKVQCELPVGKRSEEKVISDRLWLDIERDLAVRKRERQIDGQLVRVLNGDFVEVSAGLWLPKQSKTGYWAPPEAAGQSRDGPVVVRRMSLLLCVVNQVPDDVFDVALTRSTKSATAFDLARAYHLRMVSFLGEREQVEEVWALRGVGRRIEIREGSVLRLLIVDTPRWHFVWQPERNRVTASPSRLGEPLAHPVYVLERARRIRDLEEMTAVFASQKEQLGGSEVDKLTAYCPADPQQGGKWPIHGFEPGVQRKVSGMQSRTRTFWFDPKTHLLIQRRCGCEKPKYHVTVDYPPSESLSPELFTLQIPRSARLEVVDPELGRALLSQGTNATESER